jgi:hypothetical protein
MGGLAHPIHQEEVERNYSSLLGRTLPAPPFHHEIEKSTWNSFFLFTKECQHSSFLLNSLPQK